MEEKRGYEGSVRMESEERENGRRDGKEGEGRGSGERKTRKGEEEEEVEGVRGEGGKTARKSSGT